jgi:1,4-alpha-glucan branching enzyme
VARLLGALGRLYRAHPCLWRGDCEPDGFAWIDCSDREACVVSYLRRSGDDLLAVVLNASSLPHPGYRIGAPRAGRWRELLSTDARRFGGSGFRTRTRLQAGAPPWHGLEASFSLDLPPLACLVLAPEASP